MNFILVLLEDGNCSFNCICHIFFNQKGVLNIYQRNDIKNRRLLSHPTLTQG